jgi:hypothetical protein
MADAAMHRPGFRTSATLQRHTADAAALDAGRAAKEAAYKDHWQDLITAWKPAEERQAIAKTRADARARTAMEKFLEPDPDEDDEEGGDQERKKKVRQGKEEDDCAKHDSVCPMCAGTGRVDAGDDDDDDDRDDYEGDDPESILRQTTSGVEGVERWDIPDHAGVKKLQADHKKTMDAIYAEEAEQLRNAYRK